MSPPEVRPEAWGLPPEDLAAMLEDWNELAAEYHTEDDHRLGRCMAHMPNRQVLQLLFWSGWVRGVAYGRTLRRLREVRHLYAAVDAAQRALAQRSA